MRALILHASDPGFLTLPCDVRPLTVPIGLFSVETGFAQLSFWLTGSTALFSTMRKVLFQRLFSVLCSGPQNAEVAQRPDRSRGRSPAKRNTRNEKAHEAETRRDIAVVDENPYTNLRSWEEW